MYVARVVESEVKSFIVDSSIRGKMFTMRFAQVPSALSPLNIANSAYNRNDQ